MFCEKNNKIVHVNNMVACVAKLVHVIFGFAILIEFVVFIQCLLFYLRCKWKESTSKRKKFK